MQKSDAQIDRFWVVGFLLAAGLLFSINLGGLPLRDWDEGIVAQVARDLWRSQFLAPGDFGTRWNSWIHPTLAGDPYLSKPPLVHWLIALTYAIGGINEWTTRLPGAILTALSVPLLYGVGRELFPQRAPAIFAAGIYLTLLPVVRHGRLAMLDGAVLCFFLFLLFCLLRTRRDLRWSIGVGIGFGLLCLTKGILALLLGAIAILFILLDTPRLLRSSYVWSGVFLGSLPAVLWYAAQWLRYGTTFLTITLFNQSISRVWMPVENNTGAVWYYVLEILKLSLPWLIFLPQEFRLTWENRNLSWAKLTLVWSSSFLLVISLMSTKLPWYVLPVYPALALMGGVFLAEHWDISDVMGRGQHPRHSYPLAWTILFGLIAIAAWIISIYVGIVDASPKPDLQLVLVAAALTFTTTTVLVQRQDSQFILILLWGTYVSLLLLMASHLWVWELNEKYPVKPVAALIQQQVPPGQRVLTSYPYHRPSLNFYSDRQIVPASAAEIQADWRQTAHPYLLVEPDLVKNLVLQPNKSLGQAEGWLLITKDNSVAQAL